MLVLLLIILPFARHGPCMENVVLVQNATGLLVILPKTKIKMQSLTMPMPMPVPKAKATAKAKAKTVVSKSADDLLRRKKAAQLHLQPRSEASPLLAKPTGLPVLGGLGVFVPTRNANGGIPLPARISKQANARKELNANSCI